MKNVQNLLRRAAAGDEGSLQKLLEAAEPEINFICTALCPGEEAAKKTAQKSMNIISARIKTYNTSSDIFSVIRRQTAEICTENPKGDIPADEIPDGIIENDIPSEVMLSDDILSDYYKLMQCMQMIYYSTTSSEYKIFVLHFFVGMTIEETASAYQIPSSSAERLLSSACTKAVHSLSETERTDGKKLISFRQLLEAAADSEPPEDKKGLFSRSGKPFYKTQAGKIGIIGVFAAVLIIICAQAVNQIINMSASGDNTGQDSYVYSEHHTRNNSAPVIERRRSRELYIDLVCDMVCDHELLGLDTEGFVSNSSDVSVFQLIATNPDSEMINSSDLMISFANGSSDNENGKRYYTYNIFPIDERTFLINIFAPGSYMPEQFKIDMYKNGVYDSSSTLPTQIKSVDNVSVDIVANNAYKTSAFKGDIIALSEQGKGRYYYISDASVSLTDFGETTVTAAANLTLIPVGSMDSLVNNNTIDYIPYDDGREECRTNISVKPVENDHLDLPPYMSSFSFEITSEYSGDNERIISDLTGGDLSKIIYVIEGYFSYREDIVTIVPEIG